MKPWYKISDDVEYSTDFNFFYENQISITRSGSKITFHSRLEPKTFRFKIDTFGLKSSYKDKEGNSTTNHDYFKEQCLEIHKDILNGKHGIGEFVD